MFNETCIYLCTYVIGRFLDLIFLFLVHLPTKLCISLFRMESIPQEDSSQEVGEVGGVTTRRPGSAVPGAELTSVKVGSPELASVMVGSPELTSVKVGSPELTSVKVGSPELASVMVGSPELTYVKVIVWRS